MEVIVAFLCVVGISCGFYYFAKLRARRLVRLFDTIFLITDRLGNEVDKTDYNQFVAKYRDREGKFKSISAETLWSAKREARFFLLQRFGSDEILSFTTAPDIVEILANE